MGLWVISSPVSSQTKCVSQATQTVPQSNDRNLFELHNSRVGELAHFGSDMGTDSPDVNFNIPTFEMCAYDGQFDEHSPLGLRSISSWSWTRFRTSHFLVLVVNDS